MNRRRLLLGLGSALAAPAIARASSLMALHGVPMRLPRPNDFNPLIQPEGEVFAGYDVARTSSGLLILVPRWENDGKITHPTLRPPAPITYFQRS
jgi:hypothetical protein